MQEKSERSREYSERTEKLADSLGIGVSDLPEKIGVSNSMYHAYRSGKQQISPKAWRKLEAAELAAGICQGLKEEGPPYVVTPRAAETPEPTMAHAFQKLGEALDMLKFLMENMPKPKDEPEDPKL